MNYFSALAPVIETPGEAGFAARSAALAQTARTARAAEVAAPPSDPAAPEVVWYDERDLTLDLRNERSGAQSYVARELAAARTHEERVRVLSSTLRIIGFCTLAYVTMQVIDDHVKRAFFLKSYTPAQFRGHYFTQRYYEIDPRAAIGRSCLQPVVWDLALLQEKSQRGARNPRTAHFLQEMESDGMRSGVMFGMPVPHTNLQVLISFTSSNPRREWISSSTLGQALALGLSIHQFASGYTRTIARQSCAIELSEMQQSILSCLAAGLSDKEIALRLHTTVHNVDYHLRLLRKRYDVANRTQLAYMAGRMWLV